MKKIYGIQVSSTDLYISVVKTPGIEMSIWEVYVKHERRAFQINLLDCLFYLFALLGVYVSPQLCPLYFKAATFSLMLNLFGSVFI